MRRNIEVESFPAFRKRDVLTVKSIPVEIIDNIIEFMFKRLEMILSDGGQRLKYQVYGEVSGAVIYFFNISCCDSRFQ